MKAEFIAPSLGQSYPDDATWITEESELFTTPQLARIAAEKYNDNSDGWDDEWPVVLQLYIGSAPAGRFTVDREMQPYFVVKEIQP